MIELDGNQLSALHELKPSGSILVGKTGSGKSCVALWWYLNKKEIYAEINGHSLVTALPPLYIITTAKKRNDGEWEEELSKVDIERTPAITIDSWNNIKKYANVTDACFIFDEDRVVGHGSWARNFIKISKNNQWVMLTATPGDNWFDYCSVFIANGFYRSKADFERMHVIWNPYTKFPSVLEWRNVEILIRNRDALIVDLKYDKHTVAQKQDVIVPYDASLYGMVVKRRWNKWTNHPITNISEYCMCLRRVCNENMAKLAVLSELIRKHRRIIIFYNFNYELDILRGWAESKHIRYAECNGKHHHEIPTSEKWVYFVQYMAGNEAWNCIETDTMVFFSSNYSYRCMTQSAGRIDRRNTPFTVLHYYYLKTNSPIDKAIDVALNEKHDFNERKFASF